MYELERAAVRAGHQGVAGVDEAGRGPLAGPVVAACVRLPVRAPRALAGLDDSKRLSPRARDRYFDLVHEVALAVGVGVATPAEIDALNILQATFEAMRRAVAACEGAGHLLIDGPHVIPGLTQGQQAIVGGDGLSWSIAAASVVAKVTRDRLMVALDAACPGYGFARHKGYGTPAHYEALRELDLSEHHRRSFLTRFGSPGQGGMMASKPEAP
ncbi:MAG: ribonuclease HII [Candidatus Sericytochromatia bacterium]|nr:ribonuclease HII [Candidatus Sericytochromatia bacterium]